MGTAGGSRGGKDGSLIVTDDGSRFDLAGELYGEMSGMV